jgi:hypothetical protein
MRRTNNEILIIDLSSRASFCTSGLKKKENEMKNIFVVLVVFSVQAFSTLAFADDQEVAKETWTCTGEKGYSLQVTVDRTKNQVVGTITTEENTYDVQLSSAKSDSDALYSLWAGVDGHSSYDYDISLVPTVVSDKWINKNGNAVGNAVVNYSIFADCVGSFSGVEILTCKIQATAK